GLNLCFETREGILKHCSPAIARTLGDVGERFLARRQPTIEAQVANLADEIAYNNHDIDDGIRSGLLDPRQLESVDLYARHARRVRALHPGLPLRRMLAETLRAMINELVTDLLSETGRRIAEAAPADPDAVRAAGPLAAFGAPVTGDLDALKRFLRRELYRHERVARVMAQARQVIERLFAYYLGRPDALPAQHRTRAEQSGERAIADYIAGMTDRYALAQYTRLIDPDADISALRAAQ
ncbi:MAG TPA: deoxyguanosinetriphosphate triphosphohydrolase, partial [Burkholderiaceae bacterium]|nr:deoxyguanosinetriphosphate triphosphohydrolase [Burkholderiaceae bacterium]